MIRMPPTYSLIDISQITSPGQNIKTFGRLKSLFSCPHSEKLLCQVESISQFIQQFEKLNLNDKKHGYFLVLLESTNLGSAVFVKVNRWLEPGLYTVIGQTIQMGRFIVIEGTTSKVGGSGVNWNDYLQADLNLKKLIFREEELQNYRRNIEISAASAQEGSMKQEPADL